MLKKYVDVLQRLGACEEGLENFKKRKNLKEAFEFETTRYGRWFWFVMQVYPDMAKRPKVLNDYDVAIREFGKHSVFCADIKGCKICNFRKLSDKQQKSKRAKLKQQAFKILKKKFLSLVKK